MVFIFILLIILAYLLMGFLIFKIGMILPFERNQEYFDTIMWVATTWPISVPLILFFSIVIGSVLAISLLVRILMDKL